MALTTRTSRTSRCQSHRGGRGFTLIELLVVMAVIVVMAALMLSALSQAKEHGRATVCRSNMRQIALGFLMYAEDNGEILPWPGGTPRRANTNPNYAADWCAGGQLSIGPNLSSMLAPGYGFNAESGSIFPYVMSEPRRAYDPTYKRPCEPYRCPGAGAWGAAQRVNFSANAWLDPGKPFGTGAGGFVPPRGVMTTAVSDPSRKVLLVSEEPRNMLNCAFEPRTGTADFIQHLGRCNVAFVDGHMESIPFKTFRRMAGVDADNYFNLGK